MLLTPNSGIISLLLLLLMQVTSRGLSGVTQYPSPDHILHFSVTSLKCLSPSTRIISCFHCRVCPLITKKYFNEVSGVNA